jgi:hypothetical protein
MPDSPASSSVRLGTLLRAGIVGGIVAAIGNMAVYGAGRVAGVEFVGRFDPAAAPMPLMPLLPAIASLVPAVVAAFVALGFARLLRRPAVPFAVLGAVFAVVSIASPMVLADASMGTRVLLSLMHIVAGVPITAWLFRALK